MQSPSNEYKLEQSKVKLAKGGETTLVYAVPSKVHNPPTCLIIAHGAGGPIHSPFIRFFHTELASRGYTTIKFNFPYMEAHRKIPDRREVLEDSYRMIIEQAKNGPHKFSRMIIGGKSMGGRIASQVVATESVEVDGLFFLGYPLHPPGKTDRLRDEHLYKIKKPMLFVSGTRDSFAKKDLLEGVLARIGAHAQVHWIWNGDHSFKIPDAATNDSSGTNEALLALLAWLDDLPSDHAD